MAKKGKAILIAEDEASISNALQLKLQGRGYEVDVVDNGDSVLTSVQKKSYDLLLLDIMMPGKNGFEVLESLHESKKNIPAIIMSNLSQEIDKERASELGTVEFFVKSNVSLAEIVEYIAKYLG